MDKSTSLTPEVINSLFQSACEFHQEGKLKEAKSLYIQLLECIDAPLLHYNLGLVYYSSDHFELAYGSFKNAHDNNPQDQDTIFNLALSQKQCGRVEDAIESYLKLLDLESNNIDALYNLAGCYREQRCDDQAIAFYTKVLELEPNHQSATSNLAYMYQLTGNTKQAIFHYHKLLALAPGDEAAIHMLSSLSGTTPDAPPEEYIRHLFDSYSDHYEESLVQNLRYNVPLQLRKQLNQLPGRPETFTHGIDLGCGTGLSGSAFKDIITVLDGVDISEKMIALAKMKTFYHSFSVGSIATILRQTPIKYDFILAADVFSYLGNLRETFQLIARCTLPDAYFLFSTESQSKANYSLRSTGRYAHADSYIRQLAEEFHWEIVSQEPTDLRMEKDDWISGDLWIMRKVNRG